MFFKRFYDEWLAQASYLIGCPATGEAVLIDPARVIAPYLETAEAEDLQITAVTETHIHADFLSGLREVAAATGARQYLSGCGTPEWQYDFRTEFGVTVLADRDRVEVGNVLLEAVHTPGHTPEHLSFLVTDRATATEPIGIVTGDFVFVGDVGRPDLLEKAAHIANTAAASARTLFDSLTWFKTLPDHLQIWPGHGAGSACGKGLGAMPQSTVGYERRYNWALGTDDLGEFVRQVLLGQPEPPRYFGLMKRMNREGPPILGSLPEPAWMDVDGIVRLLKAGALLVDTRPSASFAQRHLKGALNIPLGRSFTTYAGSLLPYDRDLVCLLDDPSPTRVRRLVEATVSIGLDRVRAVHGSEVVEEWPRTGQPIAVLEAVSAAELLQGTNGLVLVDVRNSSEYEQGHLPGARLLPLPELPDRMAEIPPGADVVLVCQTGSRSAVAASALKAAGRERVRNLAGGVAAWIAAGGQMED